LRRGEEQETVSNIAYISKRHRTLSHLLLAGPRRVAYEKRTVVFSHGLVLLRRASQKRMRVWGRRVGTLFGFFPEARHTIEEREKVKKRGGDKQGLEDIVTWEYESGGYWFCEE
jgi:hypothetical protein